MAIEIIWDQVKDHSIGISANSWELVRSVRVKGITGNGTTKAYIAALASGLPAIGEVHPSIEDLFLDDIRGSADGADSFQINLVYRGSPAPKPDIEIIGSLTQMTTGFDADGNKLEVALDVNGTDDIQPATVNKMIPQTVWRKTWMERENPIAKSYYYRGKVNDGGWFGDNNANPRTWLCTDISGRSSDNGLTYLVTYEFTHKPNWVLEGHTVAGYDDVICYINPETGRMHQDAVYGTGYKIVQVYKEVSFSGLQLEMENLL